MTTQKREWKIEKAVRRNAPVVGMICGPGGSGKTYSALRVATGIAGHVGTKIAVLDTENGRSLHYAELFDYFHLPFDPPFNALAYLDALQTLEAEGYGVIVVDSISHMHEGDGGVLDEYDKYMRERGNKKSHSMAGWGHAKAELKKFIAGLERLRSHVIFCARAKDKVSVDQSGRPTEMGLQPIVPGDLFFSMTFSVVLPPDGRGIPMQHIPEGSPQILARRTPEQFRWLLSHKGPLDERVGQLMAEWATGATPPGQRPKPPQRPAPEAQHAPLEQILEAIAACHTMPELQATSRYKPRPEDVQAVRAAYVDRRETIRVLEQEAAAVDAALEGVPGVG
jgi:hypothetical protein